MMDEIALLQQGEAFHLQEHRFAERWIIEVQSLCREICEGKSQPRVEEYLEEVTMR